MRLKAKKNGEISVLQRSVTIVEKNITQEKAVMRILADFVPKNVSERPEERRGSGLSPELNEVSGSQEPEPSHLT